MYSLAPSLSGTTETLPVYTKPKARPVVLETLVDLKPGDVLRLEHVGKGQTQCLADNPITGPFSYADDLIGRVVATNMPAGTVVTGAYLVPLGTSQIDSRLRKFWRRCR